MADDKQIRSSIHTAYPPYPVSAYINSHTLAEHSNTMPYTTWQDQAGYRPPPPYTPGISMYNQVPPNVNPFSRYGNVSGLNTGPWRYSDSPDAEVSYYNNFTGLESDTHGYDDSRCSSTDTTMSSSSASTVFSHGSVDTDFSHDSWQTGQKRKRQTQQKSMSKKSKKENSNLNYKRWPKPPYSYCGMVIVAIQISPKKELTLQGIHAALMELFPFFRGSYLGWKDSIRHNLSHSPCFVKMPCIPPIKVGRWKVDWSKVTPALFARQEGKISQSGLYKATIHEHLGLERYDSEANTREESTEHKDTPSTPRQPKVKNELNLTPQMSDAHNFNVTLPGVEKCETQTDSPYQFRAHDSTPSNVISRSSEDIPQFSAASPAIAPSSGLCPFDFESFMNIFVSDRRSSIDAAHHLHTLCVPVNKFPLIETGAELPPLSRDSDAYLPMSPLNNETSANGPYEAFHTSAYTDSGLITISPCKTLVTSFFDSAREESARGRIVSESDRAATVTVTDDNEVEIEILDI